MLAFLCLFFSISGLSAFATSIRRSSTYVTLEQRSNPPGGFVLNGPADPESNLKITLGLTSNDIPSLEKALYDVSTPGSENYGKHLSKEEVESLAGPSAQTKTAVLQWLENNGVNTTKSSSSGEFMSFNATVSKANALFQTRYDMYTQEATGKQVIRTLSVSIPSELTQHIDVIYPSTQFPLLNRAQLTSYGTTSISTPISSVSPIAPFQSGSVPQEDPNLPPNLSVCNVSQIEPDCLLALYGIPSSVAPQNKSTILVSGLLGEFAQDADLKLFLKNFSTHINFNATFSLETIDDGQNPQGISNAGLEANLDIEYTVGVAQNVPVTFFSVGDNNTDGDLAGLLDIITAVLAEDHVHGVMTTSYGGDEGAVSPAHYRKLCNAALQLGARGTSVLFSSGDGGVSGTQSEDCITFVPAFPSGCPYVTSVGGTMGIAPEIAASFSSGGFSSVFPRPKYQDAAVEAYLEQLGDTNAGLFNSTGRGYPDVSAQSRNVIIVTGGGSMLISGTSASTPIFASFIAEVNAARLRDNKTLLGFLNPLIYSNSGLLTDITSGSNPGCGTSGFPATTGWDPVTGLGTPSFEKFVELP